MQAHRCPFRFLFAVTLLLLCFGSQAEAARFGPGDLARVNMEQVKQMLDAGEAVLFVDVRTSLQWQKATDKIPGAIRLADSSDILALVRSTPADTPIVTYCT